MALSHTSVGLCRGCPIETGGVNPFPVDKTLLVRKFDCMTPRRFCMFSHCRRPIAPLHQLGYRPTDRKKRLNSGFLNT